MVYGGLVILERAGWHRYYRLANAEIALALEALGAIAPPPHRRDRCHRTRGRSGGPARVTTILPACWQCT
jgi:hypothetical protein